MDENELSVLIIGLAIKVHATLGPGLLESVYEKALVYELSRNGLNVENQKIVPVKYDDMPFSSKSFTYFETFRGNPQARKHIRLQQRCAGIFLWSLIFIRT